MYLAAELPPAGKGKMNNDTIVYLALTDPTDDSYNIIGAMNLTEAKRCVARSSDPHLLRILPTYGILNPSSEVRCVAAVGIARCAGMADPDSDFCKYHA
jgi:hypothetical protein